MIREFQAILRRRTIYPNFGDPFTLNVQMRDEKAVKDALSSDDLVVLSVTEVGAVVDWSKPVWNLDEFAAALGIQPGTLSAKKSDGFIPWSAKYNGVPRDVAMKAIKDSLNQSGRLIAQELARAA